MRIAGDEPGCPGSPRPLWDFPGTSSFAFLGLDQPVVVGTDGLLAPGFANNWCPRCEVFPLVQDLYPQWHSVKYSELTIPSE